jgi:hypothetical protein
MGPADHEPITGLCPEADEFNLNFVQRPVYFLLPLYICMLKGTNSSGKI